MATMQGKATPFLGWTVGLGGIVLLYAAYKNKSPLSLLQQTLGVGTVTPIQTTFVSGSSGSGSATSTASTDNAGSPASASIAEAERKYGPLVTFGHGRMTLRRDAAASFNRAEAKFGQSIPLTGASRTLAQQAASAAASPGRFLPPSKGTSKHVLGIAVDISAVVPGGWNNPKLVQAMESEGWIRPGKSHAGVPEPWHWSYKERG